MGMFSPLALLEGIRKKFDDKKREVVTSRLLTGTEGEEPSGLNQSLWSGGTSWRHAPKATAPSFIDRIPGELSKQARRAGINDNDQELIRTIANMASMGAGKIGTAADIASSLFANPNDAPTGPSEAGPTLKSKYPGVNARNLSMLTRKAINSAVDWLQPFEPGATEAYSRTPEMRAGLTADIQGSKYPILYKRTPQEVESVHPVHPDYIGTRTTNPKTGQNVAKIFARGGRAGTHEARDFGIYGETWPHEIMHGASAQGNMQGVLNRTVPPGNLPIAGQFGGKPGKGDYIQPYLSKKEYNEGINLFNKFHREGKPPLKAKDLKGKELEDYKKFQTAREDAQLKAYRGQWEEVRAAKAENTGFAALNTIMMQPWNESVKGLPTININARAIPGDPHYELVKQHKLIDPYTLHELETRPESAPPIKLSDIFDLGDLVRSIREDNLPIRGVRGSHPEAPEHTFTPIRHPLESFWKEVSKELVKRGITKNLPYSGSLD